MFYVGQEVVCIDDSGKSNDPNVKNPLVKNKTYVVRDIKKCCQRILLDVDFELPYGYTLSICNICGEKLFNRIAFISHFFVPVDYTQNKKVTYKDILDEVPCFSN